MDAAVGKNPGANYVLFLNRAASKKQFPISKKYDATLTKLPMVETLQPNLVAGMKWFLGTYTSRLNPNSDVAAGVLACRGGRASRRPERTIESLSGSEIFQHLDRSCADPPGGTPSCYGRRGRAPLHLQFPIPKLEFGLNRRHKLFGHMFAGRYKSLVVDATSPSYLRTVCEYVHLNPVRAKLLRPEQPLRAYRWSSLPAYLERPGWRQFERVMEERRQQESPEDYGRIRRRWCWGEEAFRKERLAQVEERRGRRMVAVKHANDDSVESARFRLAAG